MSGINASDAPPANAPAATLDAERLDTYAVALDFHALASTLITGRGHAALRDQLDRASSSVVLNTAEGGGRVTPADKARHYAIARGSATECAAVIDILRVRRLIAPGTAAHARSLVVRIVQMLTGLTKRFRLADAGGQLGNGHVHGNGNVSKGLSS